MRKQKIFLTGATGSMGFPGMQEILKDNDNLDLVILVRPLKQDKKILAPYKEQAGLRIVWGDLTNYEDVKACVEGADIVLHVGAFVSPQADYNPKLAMDINYGSVVNIVKAVRELGQQQRTKLVSIGTVAETGDRMPPIHWGRVGDPLKPSVYDYYAVSKIAAERYVIESGLPWWVSLRQTGIMGDAMAGIDDAITLHNCLDNVLEYVSDRDSARLLRNICAKERSGELGKKFWGHIFNIGGGESCRIDTYHMYKRVFEDIGIAKLSHALDSKWFATRNFHGHYYLDSDKLNDILEFRSDSLEYFYKAYQKKFGRLVVLTKVLARLPIGRKLIGGIVKKHFLKLARTDHGTVRFTEENMEEHIAAYWGTKQAWENILPIEEASRFTDWGTVVHIDHGYDESKPEGELSLEDVQGAASFRGGKCLSEHMQTGNWNGKLEFSCSFGHKFEASPRLILEGGHWCPVCERESWNYYERAKNDAYFAQVWTPLHAEDEKAYVYPKKVSELDVQM